MSKKPFEASKPLTVSDMNSLVQQTQVLNVLSDTPSDTDILSEKCTRSTFVTKSDLANSPNFGGEPTINNIKIATTNYVSTAIDSTRPYATDAPKMDGTASAGTSNKVAKADHVHPTDTSRASVGYVSEAIDSTRPYATDAPKMDGTASAGTSNKVAKADHVHPSDDSKVTKNNDITSATKCKISYDKKGLVTGGADLTATDIPNLSTDKLTAGVLPIARGGTGAANSTDARVALDITPANIGAATSAQGTKADNAVPNTRKINGKALSADVYLLASDIGLGNVTNESKATMFANPNVTGKLTLSAGSDCGLAFPDDAYGGSGDTARITLIRKGAVGEGITMNLSVTNDADDTINFSAPSGKGVTINGYPIYHEGYLPPSSGATVSWDGSTLKITSN